MMAVVARSCSRCAASTVAFLIALLGAVPRLAALEWEGKPLSAIRFNPPAQPLHQKELDEILQLQPGIVVDRIVLREALERLYATGRYEDLQADMSAEGGAVVLTVQTKLSWFVGRISATGVKEPPNQGQLVSATKLQLGYPFAAEEVRAAAENVRAKLERNGFYDVRVNPVLDYDEDTQQVHTDFQVTAGPRARYTAPEISGATPAEVAALTRTSRWKSILGLFGWRKVSESRTARGGERMRRYYAEREHLLSDVELTAVRHDPRVKAAVEWARRIVLQTSLIETWSRSWSCSLLCAAMPGKS
jgi:outer membrane protein assembly factor BamA